MRTQTFYTRRDPTDQERQDVARCVDEFREVIRKIRLDGKSFFQDFDKHNHFKVSQKIFRQVLTSLGLTLSTDDVAKIALVYGDDKGEIKYAEFLKDANCLQYTIYGPTSGAKATYVNRDLDFTGDKEHERLLHKIECVVKKDRIRLLEYFQDHDVLRKGYLPHQKFQSVLHS